MSRARAMAQAAGGLPLGIAGPLPLWPAIVVHVALPLMAWRHLRRDAPAYADEDAPRVRAGLLWLVGRYAAAALAAPPALAAAAPTARRPAPALARVVTGLPEALALLAAGALCLPLWAAVLGVTLASGHRPARLSAPLDALARRQGAHLLRQASLG